MSIVSARFGWVFDNNFALADITHRVVGVFWVLWMVVMIFYEINQIVYSKIPKRIWMPIGLSGFGGANLAISSLLVFSGILLWFLPAVPFSYAVTGFVIHELFAFVILIAIIWHIIQKRKIFRIPLKPRKKK
ncbi:hypothetical protein [Aquibacillus kalidii]|uniref:hypothetical protein n=1 Tax=Aquibacillus kalidii TaxID=2762597 RepID=UPI001F40E25B|nr:hypothetical protein [Aquibacillus kalidii]